MPSSRSATTAASTRRWWCSPRWACLTYFAYLVCLAATGARERAWNC
jgi:hypothetical protein